MTALLNSLQKQGLVDPTAKPDTDRNLHTNIGKLQAIDADTFVDEGGRKLRVLGYDAREIDKLQYDDEGAIQGIRGGDVGGAEQTDQILQLARSQGFTNVTETGVDDYGRTLVELTDANGRKFGDALTEEGVVAPSLLVAQHQEQASNAVFSRLARKSRDANGVSPTAFDQAANWLDEFIADNSGDPQFKLRAFNEAQLAAATDLEKKDPTFRNPYSDAGVKIRSGDRYLDNKAKNPLSTSFDNGVKGAMEGLYGTLEMIGHKTGWEGLEDWAEGGKLEKQYQLSESAQTLVDFEDVEGVGDFVEYVGNLGALSLPYMINTMGAAALAPLTGGLSLASPAAVYAGQVWNEMGDTDETEKSASIAIGAGISMAVLDRLGLQGLANTSLLSSKGRQEVIKALSERGMSTAQATQVLGNATRREAAQYAGNAAEFAKDQLSKRNLIRTTLTSLGTSAGAEGLTEVGQEAIAYMAAVAGSDKEFNENDLLERLQDAAIGGAVLGGGFSIPGTAFDVGAWTDVAYGAAEADATKVADQSRWAQQEVDQYGRVRSNEEVAAEAKKTTYEGPNMADRADRETERRKARGVADQLGERLKAIPSLWRGATRYIFPPELQRKSKAARELASIFGGNLDNYLSGQSFEVAKHLRLAEYKNLLDTPNQVAQDFGFETHSRKNAGQVSDIIYRAYHEAGKDANGIPDWDTLVGTELESQIPALKKFDKAASRFTDRLWLDQRERSDLGRVEAYAYKHRSLNKAAIEKERQAFEADLRDRFGLSDNAAADLTEQILYSDTVNDLQEAYTIADKRGFKPSAHKSRTLNLSEDADFSGKWMEQNIFTNLSNMARSAARFTAYNDFVGQNNEVINNKLNQMHEELLAEGVDAKEAEQLVNSTALGMKNYLDAESGNYNRPTTDLGRRLQRMQRGIMMYTTLAGLPLATLASIVEFALVHKGLKSHQLPGLSRTGNELAHSLYNFWNDKNYETEGRKQLKDLGYFEWDVGAATVTGVTDTNARDRQILDIFFRTIGLKQWTDYTRALRGSIAMDYIKEKLEIVSGIEGTVTNEQQEARDALRNMGINIEDVLPIFDKLGSGQLTPDEEALWTDNTRTAIFNFINEAIVLPQAANRPLLYQDPRFSLFTQFQGFISAFTANQLPKLYKQAFKGQTPSMKYNAFAVMATMVMLGFASQYLKDLIKYGQTTPYLDDAEKIQRAVNSTGLLGTGERVLNLFNPIYEQRYDTSLGWFFGTVAGESAAITNLGKAGSAVGEVVEGDPEGAYRKGVKLIPGVGPLNALWQKGGEVIFGE